MTKSDVARKVAREVEEIVAWYLAEEALFECETLSETLREIGFTWQHMEGFENVER
jgi:hypothetical protein